LDDATESGVSSSDDAESDSGGGSDDEADERIEDQRLALATWDHAPIRFEKGDQISVWWPNLTPPGWHTGTVTHLRKDGRLNVCYQNPHGPEEWYDHNPKEWIFKRPEDDPRPCNPPPKKKTKRALADPLDGDTSTVILMAGNRVVAPGDQLVAASEIKQCVYLGDGLHLKLTPELGGEYSLGLFASRDLPRNTKIYFDGMLGTRPSKESLPSHLMSHACSFTGNDTHEFVLYGMRAIPRGSDVDPITWCCEVNKAVQRMGGGQFANSSKDSELINATRMDAGKGFERARLAIMGGGADYKHHDRQDNERSRQDLVFLSLKSFVPKGQEIFWDYTVY
jgi:hypothetical protein